MHDGPDSLVLVVLRRLDSKLDRVIDDLADLGQRMTVAEARVGQVLAGAQSHHAALAARLDRVEHRLGRIGDRLELAPG